MNHQIVVSLINREDDSLQKSTRTALKDARQTVYVNGRWILANDHIHYRIIKSILPSDGDYLSYFKDGQSKDDKSKDDSFQLDDIERHYQMSQQAANVRNNSFSIEINSAGSSVNHPSSSSSNANNTTNNNSSSSSTDLDPKLAASNLSSMISSMPNRLFNRYSILSGLSFTVQLVNLIAFYLNIVLPYNIPHK